MKTVGLVLAAGRSSRMGRDKALLDFRGRPFVAHLGWLLLPRVDRVVVVLGHNAGRIRERLPASPRLRAVINPDYDRGMLSSLQCGLRAGGEETDRFLWALVDHPAVRGRTLDTLLAAADRTGAPLVIPRHRGERGHPVVLSRAIATELLALPSHESPQSVVRAHYPRACFVDVLDQGVLLDVDNPAEYRRLSGVSVR